MKKIKIKKSENNPDKTRLIINTNDELSLGIILKKSELNLLKNDIENFLKEN